MREHELEMQHGEKASRIFRISNTVGSRKLEYGSGPFYAGVPSSLGFRVGGQSYSNFLASTVISTVCSILHSY